MRNRHKECKCKPEVTCNYHYHYMMPMVMPEMVMPEMIMPEMGVSPAVDICPGMYSPVEYVPDMFTQFPGMYSGIPGSELTSPAMGMINDPPLNPVFAGAGAGFGRRFFPFFPFFPFFHSFFFPFFFPFI